MQRKMIYWKLRDRELQLGERTLVMGVLNLTPDSFSDGGRYSDPEAAYARALELEAQGADVLDLGAESTRPGAEPVSADEEWRRLVPVLKKLRGALTIPVSLDTYKSETAERALQYDVHILNDPSGLTFDPALAKVAASGNMGLILNHMRGRPEQWAKMGPLSDAIGTVVRELDATQSRARHAGVDRQRIMLDPGIGFGKRKEQNSELLAQLGQLAKLELPILVGPSRKSFLAQGTEKETVYGTAAAVTAAILNGAHMVRVHDVVEMLAVVRVADEIVRAGAAAQEFQAERAVPKVQSGAPKKFGAPKFGTDEEKVRPTRPPMKRPEPAAESEAAPEKAAAQGSAAGEEQREYPPAKGPTEPPKWERRERSFERPQGDRAAAGGRGPGGRPQGDRPNWDRRPGGDRPRDDRRPGDRRLPQGQQDRPFRRDDRPAAGPGDRPPFRKPSGDRPPGKSFGKPGERRFEKPFNRPFGKPGDRPAGRPFGKPGDRPPFRKPGDRPFGNPNDRSSTGPGDRPPFKKFGGPNRGPRPGGDRPGGDRPGGRPGGGRPGDRPGGGPRKPFRKD